MYPAVLADEPDAPLSLLPEEFRSRSSVASVISYTDTVAAHRNPYDLTRYLDQVSRAVALRAALMSCRLQLRCSLSRLSNSSNSCLSSSGRARSLLWTHADNGRELSLRRSGYDSSTNSMKTQNDRVFKTCTRRNYTRLLRAV
jgi:hypothetical protein